MFCKHNRVFKKKNGYIIIFRLNWICFQAQHKKIFIQQYWKVEASTYNGMMRRQS